MFLSQLQLAYIQSCISSSSSSSSSWSIFMSEGRKLLTTWPALTSPPVSVLCYSNTFCRCYTRPFADIVSTTSSSLTWYPILGVCRLHSRSSIGLPLDLLRSMRPCKMCLVKSCARTIWPKYVSFQRRRPTTSCSLCFDSIALPRSSQLPCAPTSSLLTSWRLTICSHFRCC